MKSTLSNVHHRPNQLPTLLCFATEAAHAAVPGVFCYGYLSSPQSILSPVGPVGRVQSVGESLRDGRMHLPSFLDTMRAGSTFGLRED